MENKEKSLDPRVNRMDLPGEEAIKPLETMDQWQTYEVFHQKNRGDHHVHVGSVHAPSHELALVFAKEQYARRMKCTNLWIVKTKDVFASEYDDADMFIPGTDKSYREAFAYKNKDIIKRFKEEKANMEQPTNEVS